MKRLTLAKKLKRWSVKRFLASLHRFITSVAQLCSDPWMNRYLGFYQGPRWVQLAKPVQAKNSTRRRFGVDFTQKLSRKLVTVVRVWMATFCLSFHKEIIIPSKQDNCNTPAVPALPRCNVCPYSVYVCRICCLLHFGVCLFVEGLDPPPRLVYGCP
jgi:hypothetical protein